jgi:hypothetical protein
MALMASDAVQLAVSSSSTPSASPSRSALSSSQGVKCCASCRHTDRGSTCSRRPSENPPAGDRRSSGEAAGGNGTDGSITQS